MDGDMCNDNHADVYKTVWGAFHVLTTPQSSQPLCEAGNVFITQTSGMERLSHMPNPTQLIRSKSWDSNLSSPAPESVLLTPGLPCPSRAGTQ